MTFISTYDYSVYWNQGRNQTFDRGGEKAIKIFNFEKKICKNIKNFQLNFLKNFELIILENVKKFKENFKNF